MIPVHVLRVAIPQPDGSFLHAEHDGEVVYVSPGRIDTVTDATPEARTRHRLPAGTCAIVRYDDNRLGFRLLLVTESARDVARMRRRCILGEDPETPDFSEVLS